MLLKISMKNKDKKSISSSLDNIRFPINGPIIGPNTAPLPTYLKKLVKIKAKVINKKRENPLLEENSREMRLWWGDSKESIKASPRHWVPIWAVGHRT